MKIDVISEDIVNGCPCSPSSCPVARAIKRSGLIKNPRVQDRQVSNQDTLSNSVKLPKEVCLFIKHFDAGLKVEPFSFELQYEN